MILLKDFGIPRGLKMTNIWVVNDEYVSVAGLIGIHLGYISKGFDITKIKPESKGIFLIKERIQLLHPENKLVIDSVPSHKTKISLFLHKSGLKSDFK